MIRQAYEIRNYDRTIAGFVGVRDEYGQEYVEGFSHVPGLERQLPLSMVRRLSAHEDMDDACWEWLSSRVVPKNRAFVREILRTAGLAEGDVLGVIDVCRGLSVNDCYWVVPEGFAGKWADYNLFDNELDEALALVAYTGYTTRQHEALGLSSEWTTDGAAAKAWRRVGGRLLLYKAGTRGYANAGTEPYSELFCSQVAQACGVPHAEYWLEVWQGRLASVCPLMHGPDVAFVPWHEATGTWRVLDVLRAARGIGKGVLESVREMIVFDALVHNTDRHAGNFGLLRDCATGEVLGLAPLFDHNMALFAGDMESDFDGWARRGESDRPAGSAMSFDALSSIVMPEGARGILRAAERVFLADYDAMPIGRRRVRALEDYLRGRARWLLGLEPTSAEVMFERLEEARRPARGHGAR